MTVSVALAVSVEVAAFVTLKSPAAIVASNFPVLDEITRAVILHSWPSGNTPPESIKVAPPFTDEGVPQPGPAVSGTVLSMTMPGSRLTSKEVVSPVRSKPRPLVIVAVRIEDPGCAIVDSSKFSVTLTPELTANPGLSPFEFVTPCAEVTAPIGITFRTSVPGVVPMTLKLNRQV